MMMIRCKAKSKRSGRGCKSPAVTGREVCRMHGGATPRGTESANFKHGLYSRYARTELAARIDEMRLEEVRLHDMREVLAVQAALLGEALAQNELAAATALTEAISRGIDRYHKHHPPEGSLDDIKIRINRSIVERSADGTTINRIERVIINPHDGDPAAIRAEIDRLHNRLMEIEPGGQYIFVHGGDDPTPGTK